jgi:protein ImuB
LHWIALQPLLDVAGPGPVGPLPAGAVGAEAWADALTALGWWALQFTPKVARVGNALLLEVSASERLWGGAGPLLRHIFEVNKPLAVAGYARGATSLIALARLQASGLARSAPDALPLRALAAAQPHLGTLEKIGCHCWGQLRALPRGGVARRFGAPLLAALDRAYGLQPELYPWLVLPEVFEASQELTAQVETAPALLFGARRLFQQLQLWLQLRQRAVRAIELSWTMDARRDTVQRGALVVHSAEPSADLAHLQRLLAEQLARLTLPAPVLYLHLRTLETPPHAGETASLLPDEQRQGERLPQLLERLSARLGSAQVRQLQPGADHRPEQRQHWQPVVNAMQMRAEGALLTGVTGQNHSNDATLCPTWLLAVPRKLAVRGQRPLYPGPLTLLAGPQRIESGWWGGAECVLRDYFLARSETAGLLWIYRERLGAAANPQGADLAWYLHGVFA